MKVWHNCHLNDGVMCMLNKAQKHLYRIHIIEYIYLFFWAESQNKRFNKLNEHDSGYYLLQLKWLRIK